MQRHASTEEIEASQMLSSNVYAESVGGDASVSLRDRREREGKRPKFGATAHKSILTKCGAFGLGKIGLRKKLTKFPLALTGRSKDGRCLKCASLLDAQPPVLRPFDTDLWSPAELSREYILYDYDGDEFAADEVVSSQPVLVIGEDIIIEGCEDMDPAVVERIVAEEVERVLAETQDEEYSDFFNDVNVSQAIEGLPQEIEVDETQEDEVSNFMKEEISQDLEHGAFQKEAPQFVNDMPQAEIMEESGDLLPEIPLSVKVPSESDHRRLESAPTAVFSHFEHNCFDGGLESHELNDVPLQKQVRAFCESDYDAWDNGSLDYTCGDTYAHFPPALVTVSDGSEEEEEEEESAQPGPKGPYLPSREVLDEIHGLARAFDHKMAHRHLVKLRTLSIQYQRRIEISKAGGIQAIISSLKRFGKESGSTAKQAFAALQNLASVDTIARSIAQNKGIPVIVETMETHYKCAGVQEHGCAALRNLTSSNVANRTQVGKAGGIRTIIGAMRYHADSAKICDKAVAALGNLSLKHPENRRTIGKEGGIAAILHAMRKHDGHEGVSEKGMRALWDLAHNLLNVELLRDDEGVTDFILGVGVRFPRQCKEKAVQIYLKL